MKLNRRRRRIVYLKVLVVTQTLSIFREEYCLRGCATDEGEQAATHAGGFRCLPTAVFVLRASRATTEPLPNLIVCVVACARGVVYHLESICTLRVQTLHATGRTTLACRGQPAR